MSLINDALKQAKQTQQQNPPPQPPLEFKPVEPGQHKISRPMVLIIGMTLVAIGIIGLTAMLVWVVANRKDSDLQVQARNVDHPSPVGSEEKTAAPATPVVTPTTPAIENPEEPDTNGIPVAAVIEPPKPPALKLQGIFFNLTNPSAVLNGRTLYLGGRINGFQIMAISVNSVTLVSAAETNVLSLSR